MMRNLKFWIATALGIMLPGLLCLTIYSSKYSIKQILGPEPPGPNSEYANNKPWWDGGDECRPAEVSDNRSNKSPGGHCGHRAWNAGTGQHILSYTLYGNNNKYWKGLEANINASKQLYPGYFVRLYTDPEPYKV